eukprot:m.272634 g.272634  ORF g.272634 m.272634 type:complete len:343 (+) comp19747_c0_seq15:333-1361(+)
MTQFKKIQLQAAELEKEVLVICLNVDRVLDFDLTASREVAGIWEHDLLPLHRQLKDASETFSNLDATVLKMKSKAKLTGDHKIYNDKRCAEILQYCEEYEKLRSTITIRSNQTQERLIAVETLSSQYAMELQAKQVEADAALRAQEYRAHHAEAQATNEIDSSAAMATDNLASTQNVRAVVEDDASNAPPAPTAVRTQEGHTNIGPTSGCLRSPEVSPARVPSQNPAATAPPSSTVRCGDSEVAAITADPKHPGDVPAVSKQFTVVIASRGAPMPPRTEVELAQGDATTVLDLKRAIVAAHLADHCTNRILLISGGRKLDDQRTLRQCRLKSGCVVQLGLAP